MGPNAAGWKRLNLGEVCTLQRGHDLPSQDRRTGPYPIISSSGVSGHHESFKAQPPGVVTGRYGTLGKVFYMTEPYWPLNTSLYVVDFKGNDPLFVSYLLRTVDYYSVSDKSSVPGVNRNHLHGLEVLRPPIHEQRRIASMLSSLDDKIELNRKMAKTLEEMAQAIFRSWFVDFDPVIDNALAAGNPIPEEFQERAKRRQEARARAEAEGRPFGLPVEQAKLFPDRFEDSELGPIPTTWTTGCISQIAELVRDSVRPDRMGDAILHHFSLPAFDSAKLPTVEPASSIKSNKFRLLDGDVLVSKLNPHIPRVWYPSVYGGSVSVASTEFLVLRPSARSSTAFVYTFFLLPETLLAMQSLVNGTSNSHQRIDPSQFMVSQLVVPPDPVQGLFKQNVFGHLERSRQARAESQTLSVTRDTLLPKLISGEIQVDA
ncbi:MAG: restriction endonuclease subunit S [Fimbriimonas sp.]|nr:restriction endonuclease subunit S [Fimbriimonas sp.]